MILKDLQDHADDLTRKVADVIQRIREIEADQLENSETKAV